VTNMSHILESVFTQLCNSQNVSEFNSSYDDLKKLIFDSSSPGSDFPAWRLGHYTRHLDLPSGSDDVLVKLLREDEIELKEFAAWAMLFHCDKEASLDPLFALAYDPRPEVRKILLVTLDYDPSRLYRYGLIKHLRRFFSYNDPDIREHIRRIIARCRDENLQDLQVQLIHAEDEIIRESAIQTLIGYDNDLLNDTLQNAIADEESWVRSCAIRDLKGRGDLRTNDILMNATANEDFYVRLNASIALGERGDPRAVQPLLSLLPDCGDEFRPMIRSLLLNFDYSILDAAIQQTTLPERDRAFLQMLRVPVRLSPDSIRELSERWYSSVSASDREKILNELAAADGRYYPEEIIRMLVNGIVVSKASFNAISSESRDCLRRTASPVAVHALLEAVKNKRLGKAKKELLCEILLSIGDAYTALRFIEHDEPRIRQWAFSRYCEICDVAQLVKLYNETNDSSFKGIIISTLGNREPIDPLIDIMQGDPDGLMRGFARGQLSAISFYKRDLTDSVRKKIIGAIAWRIRSLVDCFIGALEYNDQSRLKVWREGCIREQNGSSFTYLPKTEFCHLIDQISLVDGMRDIRTYDDIEYAFQKLLYIFEDASKKHLRTSSVTVFTTILCSIKRIDAGEILLMMLKDPEINDCMKGEIIDAVAKNGEPNSIKIALELLNSQNWVLGNIDTERYQGELERGLFVANILSMCENKIRDIKNYRAMHDLLCGLFDTIDHDQITKYPWYNPDLALYSLLNENRALLNEEDTWDRLTRYSPELLIDLMISNYLDDEASITYFLDYIVGNRLNKNLNRVSKMHLKRLENFLIDSYNKVDNKSKMDSEDEIATERTVICLLADIASVSSINFLMDVLQHSEDDGERSSIVDILCQSESELVIPELLERYFDQDFNEFCQAGISRFLTKSRSPVITPLLINGLKDPRWYMRERCAYILGKRRSREALTFLLETLRSDDDWCVRRTSAQALGEICNCEDGEALEILHTILSNDPISDVRICAEWSLERIYTKKITGTPAIYASDPSVRDEIDFETLKNNSPEPYPLLDRIVAAIERFEPACRWKREREYQIDLAGYLKRQFPDLELYVEPQSGASRPDLAINDIAIEVKGPTTSQDLSTIPEKIAKYSNYYQSLVFVLFEPMYSERRCNEILSWAEKSAGLTCKFIQK